MLEFFLKKEARTETTLHYLKSTPLYIHPAAPLPPQTAAASQRHRAAAPQRRGHVDLAVAAEVGMLRLRRLDAQARGATRRVDEVEEVVALALERVGRLGRVDLARLERGGLDLRKGGVDGYVEYR